MSSKQSKKDIYKIRYKLLRELGYSAEEAKKLRSRGIDTGSIKLDEKRNVINDDEYKRVLNNHRNADKLVATVKTDKPKIIKSKASNKKGPVKIPKSQRVPKPKKAKIKGRSKAEIYRIRYQLLRELGYTSKDAKKLRSRGIDVGDIQLDESGRVDLNDPVVQERLDDSILGYDRYKNWAYEVDNDTVYSRWGMLTQDDRYRDYTESMVKRLQMLHGLSNDQAHYFLYSMLQFNMSYYRAREELLSSREFEIYDQKKRGRNKNGKK